MNMIVVYQSATGFTRQYAEWIASELGCKTVDLKHVSKQEITASDLVIYGGWLMGSTISGLKKFQTMSPRKLAIFAVGVTPDQPAYREAIREQNQLGDLPFFYMEGGIRYEKLNIFKKLMLKAIQKALAGKPDKNEQEQFMARYLGSSFDHSDRKFIAELADWVKEVWYTEQK